MLHHGHDVVATLLEVSDTARQCHHAEVHQGRALGDRVASKQVVEDQLALRGQSTDLGVGHGVLLTVVVGLETETPGSAGHTGGGSSIPVW